LVFGVEERRRKRSAGKKGGKGRGGVPRWEFRVTGGESCCARRRLQGGVLMPGGVGR